MRFQSKVARMLVQRPQDRDARRARDVVDRGRSATPSSIWAGMIARVRYLTRRTTSFRSMQNVSLISVNRSGPVGHDRFRNGNHHERLRDDLVPGSTLSAPRATFNGAVPEEQRRSTRAHPRAGSSNDRTAKIVRVESNPCEHGILSASKTSATARALASPNQIPPGHVRRAPLVAAART